MRCFMDKLQAKSLKMFIRAIQGGRYSKLKMTHNARSGKLSIEVAVFTDSHDDDDAIKLMRGKERAQTLLSFLPTVTCGGGFIKKSEIVHRRYQGFINTICVVVE